MRTGVVLLVLSFVTLRAEAQQSAYPSSVHAAAALRLAAAPRPDAQPLPATMDSTATKKSDQRQIGSLLILLGIGAIATGAVAGGTGGTVLIVAGAASLGYGIYLHLSYKK